MPRKAKKPNVLFVDWCPKDALDGMVQLEPLEELAYRRIIDLIYSTGNRLQDNDRVLAIATKTKGKWRKIKRALIEKHDKLYVDNGYLRNRKCDGVVIKTERRIKQKSKAGKASAKARKTMKPQETWSTAVGTDVPTGRQPIQEPKNPRTHQDQDDVSNINDVDAACTTVSPITAATIERARDIAPGYSIEEIERRFLAYNAQNGVVLKNPQAAFLGFVRRFKITNPIRGAM